MAEQKLFGVSVEDTPLFGEPVPTAEESESQEYEGVFQEFGEGLASGASKLIQGPLELLAQASDYTMGTDYHDDVVEGFESAREYLGLDPQGLAGAIGEVGLYNLFYPQVLQLKQ